MEKYESKQRDLFKRFTIMKNQYEIKRFLKLFTCNGIYKINDRFNNETDKECWELINNADKNDITLHLLFLNPKSSHYDYCEFKIMSVVVECVKKFGSTPKKALWLFDRVDK